MEDLKIKSTEGDTQGRGKTKGKGWQRNKRLER